MILKIDNTSYSVCESDSEWILNYSVGKISSEIHIKKADAQSIEDVKKLLKEGNVNDD